MSNLAQELLDMKEKLDQAKQYKAETEGRLRELFDRLMKEFKCRHTKQGRTKLAQTEKERNSNVIHLEEGVEKLQTVYNWE